MMCVFLTRAVQPEFVRPETARFPVGLILRRPELSSEFKSWIHALRFNAAAETFSPSFSPILV